jgi:hypothetical protein
LTKPPVIHRFQDNDAVAGPMGGDTAAPHLAAILHSYEEAKANIVDPAPAWPSPADDEPFPATEKIDGRMVMLPSVPDEAAGTEAMSTAARVVAENLALEEMGPPATSSDPGPERGTASPGRRGWWRSLRNALHGGGPSTRPES